MHGHPRCSEGVAGHGGRCTEFLLSLAIDLAGLPNVHAIACDTDGIDGTEDNAGAVLAPDTLARAAALGLNAKNLLADHDSYGFFSALIRPRCHGTDAHQRQRLPRDPDRLIHDTNLQKD